jgi:hypothetical protein
MHQLADMPQCSLIDDHVDVERGRPWCGSARLQKMGGSAQCLPKDAQGRPRTLIRGTNCASAANSQRRCRATHQRKRSAARCSPNPVPGRTGFGHRPLVGAARVKIYRLQRRNSGTGAAEAADCSTKLAPMRATPAGLGDLPERPVNAWSRTGRRYSPHANGLTDEAITSPCPNSKEASAIISGDWASGPAIRLRQHLQPQSVAKTRGTSVLRFEQACHMSTDADGARPHHHDASANAGRQAKERPLEAMDIGEPSAGHDAWPHAVDCMEFTRQSQRFGDSVKSLNRISWINLLAGQCWMR